MYAVFETGGKQFKVSPGQIINVDRLRATGETVEFDKVHMIADGDNVTVGNPVIPGARVITTIVSEEKTDKVLVFKYKPKTRYRVKRGHRQPFTRLAIKEIIAGTGKES